jgi:two-component system nitrate/nitrite response regulator NarL
LTEPITIAVADDHPLFRQGVIDTLNSEEGFSVIGEAGNGDEAFRLIVEHAPDVLLLDIAMPRGGGIATAERVAAAYPQTRVLMLTVSENPDDLMKALKAGARGYLLKGVQAHGLVHAVRAVTAGEVFVSPALASTILYEMTHPQPTDPFDELTEREQQILALVGEGLTNREIGERLYLAEKTIKHYMTSVLQKLHVRNRVEAALLAMRQQSGDHPRHEAGDEATDPPR